MCVVEFMYWADPFTEVITCTEILNLRKPNYDMQV